MTLPGDDPRRAVIRQRLLIVADMLEARGHVMEKSLVRVTAEEWFCAADAVREAAALAGEGRETPIYSPEVERDLDQNYRPAFSGEGRETPPQAAILAFVEEHIAASRKAGDEFGRGWNAAMHNIRNKLLEAGSAEARAPQGRQPIKGCTCGDLTARRGRWRANCPAAPEHERRRDALSAPRPIAPEEEIKEARHE
jgi:hypothetical protein